MNRIIFYIYFSTVFFLTVNCFSPIIIYPLPEPEIIEIKSNSFTLQWDNYSINDPISFNVYYKKHNTITWNFLGNTPTLKEYTIFYDQLDNGIYYDFGASSIYLNEDSSTTESEIHSSLDRNADPDNGWYIKWLF